MIYSYPVFVLNHTNERGYSFGYSPRRRIASVRRLDEFHTAPGARRAREPTIARQQHRIQHLGERHVDGIVRAQVVSKCPHSIEQRFMGVALQIQRTKILEGDGRVCRVETAVVGIPPKCLSDLDISEV